MAPDSNALLRQWVLCHVLSIHCSLPGYHCDNCSITVHPEKVAVCLQSYSLLWKRVHLVLWEMLRERFL